MPSGLFLQLKGLLKGQRFASAEEVSAKATRALTEASKNDFHAKGFTNVGKSMSLSEGTILEKMSCNACRGGPKFTGPLHCNPQDLLCFHFLFISLSILHF
jgi:hypothetical protein